MKIVKKEALTETYLEEYFELIDSVSIFETEIINRIDYILKFIYNEFNSKFECWYVDGADEGEIGKISSLLNGDEVSPCVESPLSYGKEFIIILDGVHWDLKDSFPKEWLFKDFEDKTIEGKKKYKELIEEEKVKAEIRIAKLQEKEKQELSNIKSKLTDEELRLLKNHLKD